MNEDDITQPDWLSVGEVKTLHDLVLERSGGAQGVRDENLLESAVARPQNLHAYGETDPHQLAAGYAEGISRNHAFVDGNKRTAFMCADEYLCRHGYLLDTKKSEQHAEQMENLAQGLVEREQFAQHLKENSYLIERERSETAQRQPDRAAIAKDQQARDYADEFARRPSPDQDRSQDDDRER